MSKGCRNPETLSLRDAGTKNPVFDYPDTLSALETQRPIYMPHKFNRRKQERKTQKPLDAGIQVPSDPETQRRWVLWSLVFYSQKEGGGGYWSTHNKGGGIHII